MLLQNLLYADQIIISQWTTINGNIHLCNNYVLWILKIYLKPSGNKDTNTGTANVKEKWRILVYTGCSPSCLNFSRCVFWLFWVLVSPLLSGPRARPLVSASVILMLIVGEYITTLGHVHILSLASNFNHLWFHHMKRLKDGGLKSPKRFSVDTQI